eukprot:366113-Chlamydomonas_euryale.AAC.24
MWHHRAELRSPVFKGNYRQSQGAHPTWACLYYDAASSEGSDCARDAIVSPASPMCVLVEIPSSF